jgi:hypothetical protein
MWKVGMKLTEITNRTLITTLKHRWTNKTRQREPGHNDDNIQKSDELARKRNLHRMGDQPMLVVLALPAEQCISASV